MREAVPRRLVLIVLILAAGAFAAIGAASGAPVFSDIWSQLFWVTVTTAATAFVLETLLAAELDARRRENDWAAFRVFAARILDQITEVAGRAGDAPRMRMVVSAGETTFADAAARRAGLLSQSEDVDAIAYHRVHPDVANGLRRIGDAYIRIFSSSWDEMAMNHDLLFGLASRWRYRDDLVEQRPGRTSQRDADRAEVRTLIRETAETIKNLSARAGSPGMPPAP
jgi:hypothetical protein